MFLNINSVGRSATMMLAGLVCVVYLSMPSAVEAQPPEGNTDQSEEQGGFPDASFEMLFRKYTSSGNKFSPIHSWDGHLGLNATVFRKESGAVYFWGAIQAVGTENFGSTVSVGDTGYLLGFGYVHTLSDYFKLSSGLAHLSSHLTRDLDAKLEEERNEGTTIPDVADPPQYNVIFFKVYRKFSAWRFTHEVEVALQPVNFFFNGRPAGDVRPVYLATRSTLWEAYEKSVTVETQHEFGKNPFNRVSLFLELFARTQQEGRFQVFVSASPGRELHISPTIGRVRDGIAFGMRMKFRS